jgi:hypothetical protein
MVQYAAWRRAFQLLLLLALGSFMLLHPPTKVSAAAACIDCPQGVTINTPDCPWGSPCAGCWRTCIVDTSCTADFSCAQCTAWEMTCVEQPSGPPVCTTKIFYDGPCNAF